MNRGMHGYGIAISPQTLRAAVGTIGVALPAVVVLVSGLSTGTWLRPSISDYYVGAQNELVGLLFAVAMFFFAYRGFDEPEDRIAGALACIGALGVALFPCTDAFPQWCNVVHFISAGALFLTLAFFSLVLFTRSNTPQPSPQKVVRNRVYRACGGLMLFFIAVAAACLAPGQPNAATPYHAGFWSETGALLSFGVSWWTKSELLPFLAPDPNDDD